MFFSTFPRLFGGYPVKCKNKKTEYEIKRAKRKRKAKKRKYSSNNWRENHREVEIRRRRGQLDTWCMFNATVSCPPVSFKAFLMKADLEPL